MQIQQNKLDVLLMSTNFDFESMTEPTGIAILTSILTNRGISTFLLEPSVDSMSWEQCAEFITSQNPRILGISIHHDLNVQKVISLVEKLRHTQKDLIIVLGGQAVTLHYATSLYKPLIQLCNAIFLGEAENNFPLMVQKVINLEEWHDIPGIVYMNKGELVKNPPAVRISDLNELPMQDRSVLRSLINKHPNMKEACVHFARGCNYACSFCSADAFRCIQNDVKRVRRKSLENLFNEIKYLYFEFGIRKFDIEDENFIEKSERYKNELRKFSDSIRTLPEKIRFTVMARVDCIDYDTVSELKSAGLSNIFLGVDSIDEEDLVLFNKKYTAEAVYDGMDKLISIGYSTQLDSLYRLQIGYITFHPYSTLKRIRNSLEFFKRYATSPKLIEHRLRVYGTTPIRTKLDDDHLLLHDDFAVERSGSCWKFIDENVDSLYRDTLNYYEKWLPFRDGIRHLEKFAIHEVKELKNELSRLTDIREKLDKDFFDFFEKLLVSYENEMPKEERVLFQQSNIDRLYKIIPDNLQQIIDELCSKYGIGENITELLRHQNWLPRYRRE